MIVGHQYKISVITAVYNAESCIGELIESLRRQEDPDFEWVVVDGLSTDRTLETLGKVNDLNIRIISEADFGIYDALNKGVKACSGEYYLVAGADDIFFPNAIKDYKAAIRSDIDLITASIVQDKKVSKPEKGPSWRSGQFAWVSAHALGLLIKKELHIRFGYYSRKFPIAADQLFIKTCCQNGANLQKIEAIVGEFGIDGVSSHDAIGTSSEFFRIQILTEKNKWLQYILFMMRLFRRIKDIK